MVRGGIREFMNNADRPAFLERELVGLGVDILYECTKYHSLRDKLRERALVEGVVWPPLVDFWMWKECHRDFAAYVGRVLRLRADEELRAQPRLHN